MSTSKRSLLLLCASLKQNIKELVVPPEEMDKIYSLISDVLGEVVLLNFKTRKGR